MNVFECRSYMITDGQSNERVLGTEFDNFKNDEQYEKVFY